MGADKTREPKHHSPRVASWIYEVINPLLDAIPLEVHLLEENHSTFRYWNGRLEYLKPIADYLTPSARHVLSDFERKNKEVAKRLENHDELRAHLESAARDAHAAVLAQPAFAKLVDERLREYATTGPRHPGPDTYPGGAVSRDDYPKVIAQYLVNESRELPSNYTDSVFWSRFGKEFLAFASAEAFERLRKARTRLLEDDRALLKWLEDTRFELCEKYDVPAAPSSLSQSE